jgi:hypothetical protein
MTPEEIDAEIKRLTELKQTVKSRGRPTLTEDELYEREMARKRAKQRAKEAFERETAEKTASISSSLPDARGLWQNDGWEVVAVVPSSTGWVYTVVQAGVISGPSLPVSDLVGEWEQIDVDPTTGKTLDELTAHLDVHGPVSATLRSEVDEHITLMQRYVDRRVELQPQGKKPCANKRCDAVLEYGAIDRFCKACLKNPKG